MRRNFAAIMPVVDIHSVGFWVVACFALIALYQMGVYLFLYGKLAFYKTDKAPSNKEKYPVSVIICAKQYQPSIIMIDDV